MKRIRCKIVEIMSLLFVFFITISFTINSNDESCNKIVEDKEYHLSDTLNVIDISIYVASEFNYKDWMIIKIKNDEGKIIYKSKKYPNQIIVLTKSETDSIINGLYKIYIEGDSIINKISKTSLVSEYTPLIINIDAKINDNHTYDLVFYSQFDRDKMITYTKCAHDLFDRLQRYRDQQRMYIMRKDSKSDMNKKKRVKK